jgi:hypothetical protein
VPSASWTLTDALGVAANLATIAALLYAAYQVRQARITSSSTAAATIFSNIKRGIDEVASQTEEDGLYEATCGLLNEIEISCAIYLDGQFGGNTGKIATSFIKDILASIEKNERLLACSARAIHSRDTFDCIRRFCQKYKEDWKPLRPTSVESGRPIAIGHAQEH